MAELIQKKERKVNDNNGSPYCNIPKDWLQNIDFELGDDVVVSLMKGKHGYFIGIWSEESDVGLGEKL